MKCLMSQLKKQEQRKIRLSQNHKQGKRERAPINKGMPESKKQSQNGERRAPIKHSGTLKGEIFRRERGEREREMEKGKEEERKTKLAYAHKIKDAFNAALYPAEKRDKEPVLGMEILFRHANRAKGMGRGVLLPLEVNEDDIKLRVRVYLVYKNSVVTKTDFLRDSVGGSKSRKDFKVKPRRDTDVWVSWSQLIPKPVEELKDDSQIDEWLASVTDASVREVEVQVNEQKWTHSPFTKTALDLDLHQLLAKNITVKVSSYNKRKSIVAVRLSFVTALFVLSY